MTVVRRVESVADIGAAVRERRCEMSLTQQQLADRAGTTRQWVNRLERGDGRAVMLKAMAVLEALGLELAAEFDTSPR